MKGLLLLISYSLLAGTLVMAQVHLPEVLPQKIGRNRIEPFDVNKVRFFKQTFPDFLVNGKYAFGVGYPRWDKSVGELSSAVYPATYFESGNTLDKVDSLVVMLNYEPGTDFFEFDDKPVHYNDDIIHAEEYNLDKKWLRNHHARMNDYFSETVTKALQDKKANKVIALPIGTKDISQVNISPDYVILDITMEKRFVCNYDYIKYFPSYMLYSLTVRNAFGEPLKKYNQVVFAVFTAHSNWLFLQEDFFEATFQSAFKSLINQFLNDDAPNKLKQQQEMRLGKRTQSADYRVLEEAMMKYGVVSLYKEELKSRCATLHIGFDALNAQITADSKHVKDNALPYNYNLNAQTNSALQSVNSVLGTAIYGIFERQIQKRNEKKANILVMEIAGFNRREAAFLDSVAELSSSADKDAFISSIKQRDESLTDVLNAALKSKEDSRQKLSETFSQNTNNYLSDLSNSIAQRSSLTTATSAAVTNSNGTGASSDACMAQATAEWKKSPEYIKCSGQTVVNTSQASCQRAKAKLLELTLKYCRSKLNAAQIAGYEKERKEALQSAADLEKSAFH